MLASEALWLILALALTLGCLGWMVIEYTLIRRELQRTETERRSLDYQLMRACTRFEAERHDLQQALLRSRGKRADAAAEVEKFKSSLVEALDLLAAYRQFGGSDPESTLAKLRDDVSQFGHLMEEQDP